MTYDFISIPVPSALVIRVVNYMATLNSKNSLNDVLDRMIEYGLDNAEWKYKDFGDDILGIASSKNDFEKGYLWTRGNKSLFLPHGTQIMRKYKGKDYFAKVENNFFTYEDKTFNSAAELARFLSGATSVNAWLVLWIRRPSDNSWKLAANLAEQN